MKRVAEFDCIIATSKDMSQVIYAPDEAFVGMDGCVCEDNCFRSIPSEPGIYLCHVDFYFEQGYFDGYEADGESDWEYRITKVEQCYNPSYPIMIPLRWVITGENEDVNKN